MDRPTAPDPKSAETLPLFGDEETPAETPLAPGIRRQQLRRSITRLEMHPAAPRDRLLQPAEGPLWDAVVQVIPRGLLTLRQPEDYDALLRDMLQQLRLEVSAGETSKSGLRFYKVRFPEGMRSLDVINEIRALNTTLHEESIKR